MTVSERIVIQTNVVIQAKQQQNRQGRGSRNTSNAPRDGVKKVHIPLPINLLKQNQNTDEMG